MTVYKLIQELAKFKPDQEVIIQDEHNYVEWLPLKVVSDKSVVCIEAR